MTEHITETLIANLFTIRMVHHLLDSCLRLARMCGNLPQIRRQILETFVAHFVFLDIKLDVNFIFIFK